MSVYAIIIHTIYCIVQIVFFNGLQCESFYSPSRWRADYTRSMKPVREFL